MNRKWNRWFKKAKFITKPTMGSATGTTNISETYNSVGQSQIQTRESNFQALMKHIWTDDENSHEQET